MKNITPIQPIRVDEAVYLLHLMQAYEERYIGVGNDSCEIIRGDVTVMRYVLRDQKN